MKYYTVTESGYEGDFRKEVEKWLNQGWKLHGGVSIALCNQGTKIWCQALVKGD